MHKAQDMDTTSTKINHPYYMQAPSPYAGKIQGYATP